MKFSLLSAAGMLVSILVVSQGKENDGKKYISMEEITEQMKKQYEEAMFEKDVGGGLRGLQATCQQWACLEPNDDLIMTFAGRTWGNCNDMNPCLCGLMPLQMAYWCGKKCRPDCGGTCALPENCPNGFAVEPDGSVAQYDYALPPPPWEEWICPLGTACPTAAPTPFPTDMPTPSPTGTTRSSTGGTRAPALSPIWYMGG
mmetsp:Transcript_23732/g.43075  ORF Transcript_23732/g.43075 Transcript_23732/m.43075 type:complete len:201 (-) Transcript_23732:85-687(-)|eukprot:CAMPEP_0202486182 /NCGR_PEP_ID=MMETSP1361-20130828/4813_1 /ASSEMBLY_ACC=CAM_ASM_000849 /TAXON_ID=210615 /ORGANISM="Staurosira complex sp., Strain CCMP2646" /LENGTH=200 /DNA_ID=CAMNT_0049115243 /DNA_START=77 /DNA_END=679 /DNA_ORIENTATION=+